MKKLVKLALILGGAGVICNATVPSEEKFHETISKEIHTETLDRYQAWEGIDPRIEGIAEQVADVADVYVNSLVEIDNRGLYNVATVKSAGGEVKSVAVGFLGKVFVFSKKLGEQITPVIRPAMDRVLDGNTQFKKELEDILGLNK